MFFTAHLTTLLRSLVLNRLIRFGATHFTDAMRKKFEQHCNGVELIPADERSAVYRTVIAADGKQAFDQLIKVIFRCICVLMFESLQNVVYF
jgi:puromycin-sensitive aminopeptidase